MADNVQFQSNQLATPASGTTVSTDEASSGHIQRVKLAYSANGADTHVPADANGLSVNTGAHLDDVVNAVATTDQAITTKSAVFGYTTSGGGSFQPVKVTPSGSLTVEINDGGGSITIDGTVTANAGSGPFPVSDNGGSLTVDGTVAATQSGTWNVGITGNVALPAGAATEYSLALAGSNLAAITTGSNLRVLGLVDARQSGPYTVGVTGTVPVTDNNGSLTVDGTVAATQSGTWNVGITGTPALAANASTEYTLATLSSNFTTALNGSNLRVGGFVDARQTGAWSVGVTGTVPVTDNSGSLTVDNNGTFAVQAAQSGTWNVNNIAGTISLPTGAATETSVAAVAAAASGSNLRVIPVLDTPIASSAASVYTVAGSATSVTLAVANTGRVGVGIFNDSTALAYIKFGATASTTSFTVRLDPGGYYELAGHGIYTGIIDCIWATATGNARVSTW